MRKAGFFFGTEGVDRLLGTVGDERIHLDGGGAESGGEPNDPGQLVDVFPGEHGVKRQAGSAPRGVAQRP